MNEYYVIKDMEAGLFIDSTFKVNIFEYCKEFLSEAEAYNWMYSDLVPGHYTVIKCYRKLP